MKLKQVCVSVMLMVSPMMAFAGKDFILIANGKDIGELRLRALLPEKTILALDGATNHLYQKNIVPHVILGDFDSIDPETKAYYKKKRIPVIHAPDQAYSDLEKAIKYCDREEATSITITNALGGRTDHMLANISFLKKYYNPKRPIILVGKFEVFQFVRDDTVTISGEPGKQCAVIGFPHCTVNSEGLEFELKNKELDLFTYNSTSNKLAKKEAKVTVKGDALVIMPTKS